MSETWRAKARFSRAVRRCRSLQSWKTTPTQRLRGRLRGGHGDRDYGQRVARRQPDLPVADNVNPARLSADRPAVHVRRVARATVYQLELPGYFLRRRRLDEVDVDLDSAGRPA